MDDSTLAPKETTTSTSDSGRQSDIELAVSILNRLLAAYGTRDFAVRLWDGTTVPPDPGQEARFTLVLNSPRALRRMLLLPNELALAEAYLDGDYDLEGDVLAAMRLGDVFEGLAMGIGDCLGLVLQAMALPSGASGDGGDRRGALPFIRARASLRGVSRSGGRGSAHRTYAGKPRGFRTLQGARPEGGGRPLRCR